MAGRFVESLTVALLGDLTKFDKTMKGAQGTTQAFSTKMKEMGKDISSVGNKMTLALTVPLIAFGGLALKAANESARLTTALEGLAGGSEQAAEFIKRINEVSLGTISNLDAMAVTTKALTLGVVDNADAMAELVEIAITLGRAQGLTATKAVDDLTTALGRQSPMILDNLGIQLKLTEAYDIYADQLGKTAEELSDTEKQQAFLNAALQKGGEVARKLGGIQEDAAAQTEQLGAAFSNLKVEVGESLSGIVTPLISDLAEKIVEWKEAWDEFPEEKQARIIKLVIGLAAAGPIVSGVGRITTAIGALWATALGPAGLAFGALIGALVWFENTGGIAQAYDNISDLIKAFGDLGDEGEDVVAVTEAIVESLTTGMREATTAVNLYIRNVETGVANYQAAMRDIANAQLRAEQRLREGMRFDDVVKNFQSDMGEILAGYGFTADEMEALTGDIFDSMLTGWTAATGVVVGSAHEMSNAQKEMLNLTNQNLLTAMGMWHDYGEFVSDTADEVVGSTVAIGHGIFEMTDAQKQAMALHQAWLDAFTSDAEEWGTQYKEIIATTTSDVIWMVLDFHNTLQEEEVDHAQRMTDIIEGASDRAADIAQGKNRSIEDEQVAHDRKLEDIERWYQQQVSDGQAATADLRRDLDEKYKEQREQAERDHARKLEDIDLDYTRAIDDNIADRVEAQEEEVAAYEENRPKITEIVKQGFVDMVNAIAQSAIDTAIQSVIDDMWNMAKESKKAVDETNTNLANIGSGGGGGLPGGAGAALAFAAPIAFGATDPKETHKFGQQLDKVLRAIFGIGKTGAAAYDGVQVTRNEFHRGGVAPGPRGVPQSATVLGGEVIGIDYQQIGGAVEDGVRNALQRASNSQGEMGLFFDSVKVGKAIGPAIMNPIITELSRRGQVIAQ